MHPEEIERTFNSPAGYLGPVKIPAFPGGESSATQKLILESLPLMLADNALKERKNLISGANKENYHLKNITPGRDFHPTEWADLRNAAAGSGGPGCCRPLFAGPARGIGPSFKLRSHYFKAPAAPLPAKDGRTI